VATDHEDYAMEIAENFSQVNGLESTLGAPYINDLGDYYKTKYYRKFAASGKVFFFNMRRV
jgi:tRNA (guanine-N7-)-methyltransferase